MQESWKLQVGVLGRDPEVHYKSGFGKEIAWMVSNNTGESSSRRRAYLWFSITGQACK